MKLSFLAPLHKWFSGLQPQEQRALKLLSLFLLAVVVWLKLWLPLQAGRDASEARYHQAAAELKWMEANADAAKAVSQAAAPSPADASLLTLSSDTAQMYHLAISHAEPAQDGSLHVSLENAAFSHVLPWLDTLAREHGVQAASVSIERKPESEGYVNATIVLQNH